MAKMARESLVILHLSKVEPLPPSRFHASVSQFTEPTVVVILAFSAEKMQLPTVGMNWVKAVQMLNEAGFSMDLWTADPASGQILTLSMSRKF